MISPVCTSTSPFICSIWVSSSQGTLATLFQERLNSGYSIVLPQMEGALHFSISTDRCDIEIPVGGILTMLRGDWTFYMFCETDTNFNQKVLLLLPKLFMFFQSSLNKTRIDSESSLYGVPNWVHALFNISVCCLSEQLSHWLCFFEESLVQSWQSIAAVLTSNMVVQKTPHFCELCHLLDRTIHQTISRHPQYHTYHLFLIIQ